MKKILVPTDFSSVADNAMQYAIEIASEFKSELYLYHVYAFDRFNFDLNLPEDEQPFPKTLERKMNLRKLRFQEKITRHGVSLTTIIEKGDIFSLFKRKVKEHGIDLIIMGSKGATGLEKVIFGSIAAKALEMARVPVLVVPPGFTFRPPEHVVLAIDNKEVSSDVLSPLQKLAFSFGAEVYLLNIKPDTKKNAYMKIDLNLDGVKTTYREVPLSKSINESINEFIGQAGCDLLCMVRREKGFFKSLFHKSITKTQVYDNQVPLLVLPEKS